MDYGLWGSSVRGISQARRQGWVAISFFRGSSWPRDQTRVSCIGRQVLYHWATWETTHSMCHSLYLLTPTFHSILPPSPVPIGNHTSILYVCESLFVSSIGSFVIFYMPCINDVIWYLSFSVWLTSLGMISTCIHVEANGIISFFFYGWGVLPLYMRTTSLSIHLLLDS